MSVRVGVGWSPFEAADLASGRFWRAVETMDELGYDSLWLSDTATLATPAPLVALAAVAARSERLKLGTGVLVAPPRNPVLLAKELATLDALSGGRVLPGVGLGTDVPAELEAMGVPRAERGARTEEAIEIVRALWSGEPTTFEGRFHRFVDVTLTPTPASERLDIWLGGRSPAALRRAGRIADGWLGSFVSADEVGGLVEAIREHAAAAGNEIEDDHYGVTLFAAPRREELSAAALDVLHGQRADLPLEEHVAFGADEARRLLERFVAAGIDKFVLVPVADDLDGWLRELHREAVAPVERA